MPFKIVTGNNAPLPNRGSRIEMSPSINDDGFGLGRFDSIILFLCDFFNYRLIFVLGIIFCYCLLGFRLGRYVHSLLCKLVNREG
jgi:hypothetical protein